MDAEPEQLLQLWQANADPWTSAVRGGHIASRALATDRAVLDAVLARRPQRVLDVGCGEGWLTRALTARGIDTLGLDAVPALIDQARGFGPGRFEVARIADLMTSALAAGFDVWVCNFSLFHPDDGVALAAAAARRLPPHGALILQTLHENATLAGAGSPDGWQPGSWGPCAEAGADAAQRRFGDPIPWYFRRTASWRALLAGQGLSDLQCREPMHPATGRALSQLLIASRPTGPQQAALR